MLAFMEGQIRFVEVYKPNNNQDFLLGQVYHYGQNDFQLVEGMPSVSVGDVIELNDKLFMVIPMGFKEITQEELNFYKTLNRVERITYSYGFSLK